MEDRASGILLHPSSLPGRFATGDLGPGADRFLEWLQSARQSLWQFLPLGPPGPGSSPYSAYSAFAGNVALLSPERLVEQGLVDRDALSREPEAAAERPSEAAAWRRRLAAEALRRCPRSQRRRFAAFARGEERPRWLDDWTLFAALKERYDGRPWTDWPADVRRREDSVLAAARSELAETLEREAFAQFLFFDQWRQLRRSAAERGVRLFGDLPIYVASDSADTWSRPELFQLDESGRALAVAGVPPDYFSPEGQLWGNPLYDWQRVGEEGYAWWIERVRWQLALCDVLRVDHFRGLVAYWEVPATAGSARQGRWVEGPGRALFQSLRETLGSLPLVAEDLGVITDDVTGLREELGLMGMKVLQFAFDEVDSSHLPHRHTRDTVVYTGTHDNDTTVGWLESCSQEVRERLLAYAGDGSEPHWDLLRMAWTSVARWAIAPLQDVLGLGAGARMNRPSVPSGNWRWRLDSELPDPDRLARLTELCGRAPSDVEAAT